MIIKKIRRMMALVGIVCLSGMTVFPALAGDYVSESAEEGSESTVSDFRTELLEDGTLMITGYTGTEENVTIPETIGGIPVSRIEEYAFCNNQSIKTVVIPGSVTNIDEGAFVEDRELTSVTFSDGLISIGPCAFAGCSSLKQVSVPASVTEIGIEAFRNCDALVSIAINNKNCLISAGDSQYEEVTISSQATIMAPCDSYAYKYAVKYKRNFESLSHVYVSSVTKKASATTSVSGEVSTSEGQITNVCSVCGHVAEAISIACPKTVQLSATKYVYDGKQKKPTVTIYDSAGKKIAASNYTVAYAAGLKNAGTYKLTIKFQGDYYRGTLYKTFQITKASQKITTKAKASKTYKASKLKKKKAVFNIGAKTSGEGTLTYKVTKYPKGAKKYISVNKKGKVTLSKGAKKGTYKVTVTAKKTTNYKKAAKVISIKVK